MLVLFVKLNILRHHDSTRGYEDNRRIVMDGEGRWKSVTFSRPYGVQQTLTGKRLAHGILKRTLV